jgi:hypothetical protein
MNTTYFAAQDLLVTFLVYGVGYFLAAVVVLFLIYRAIKHKGKINAKKYLRLGLIALVIIALGTIAMFVL